MRFHVGFLPGFAIAIADDPAHTPAILGIAGAAPNSNKVIRPSSIKIQLRDTKFRKMDGFMQKEILDKLSTVSCASMRVTVSGDILFEDTSYIRRVTELMGPVLLSKHAAMWANHEILRDAKYLADGTARLGELPQASSFYCRIFVYIAEMLQAHGTSLPYLVTWKNLDALRFDVMCALGYLEIKLRGATNIAATASHISAWVGCDLWELMSKGEEAYFRHLCFLCDLCLSAHETKEGTPTMSVEGATGLLSGLRSEPHIVHDLGILQEVSKEGKNEPAYKHLLIKNCSASMLPLPQLSFHTNQHLPKKPDYLVGRQNMEAQRFLKGSVKKEINRIQTKLGQKVTEWG